MGWYGPPGNCGCCEEALCDGIGLVTDSFSAVSPKWQSFASSSPNICFIDTGKPGIKTEFIAGPTGGGTTGGLWRCLTLPSGSPFTVRFKANIAVDPTFSSGNGIIGTGLTVYPTYTIPGSFPVVNGLPINLLAEYNAFSGVWTGLSFGPFSSSSTAHTPGQSFELVISTSSAIAGATVSADVEYWVGGSLAYSNNGAFEFAVGQEIALIHRTFIPTQSGARSYEFWSQNHESELTYP